MDVVWATAAKILWNKGRLVRQKAPLKLKDIWAIPMRLKLGHAVREVALFDLDLDSMPRVCDLVRLRVRDICHGDRVSTQIVITQQKTAQSVRFKIT